MPHTIRHIIPPEQVYLLPYQLEDNIWLILAILLFLLVDIFSIGKTGQLRMQAQLIRDTRNARIFADNAEAKFNPLRPILYSQLFGFSGLSLYCAITPDAAQRLYSPTAADWLSIVVCLMAPMMWYFFQQVCFNWFSYLFDDTERSHILNRAYRAIHLLVSPIALVIFVFQFAGHLSQGWTLFLLAALFILSQLTFIFHGFKIFLGSFGSLCFIIAYLCALEIAPLLIFWHKIA